MLFSNYSIDVCICNDIDYYWDMYLLQCVRNCSIIPYAIDRNISNSSYYNSSNNMSIGVD